MEAEYGVCRYCGQVNINIDTANCSKEEADALASKNCGCSGAKVSREREGQIQKAKERIEQLFGISASLLGFEPVNDDVVEMLNNLVPQLAEDTLLAITVYINSETKAKLAMTAKGKIKVERTDTTKYQLEE